MKQLIGTGLITLTNIMDGSRVDIWYSPTKEIEFEKNEERIGNILTPSWHTPSKEGDIYMVQRIGGDEEPWGQVIRMEGQAGISYRMRGTWRPGIEYTGECEYVAGKPVSPVILKGSIDLVIHEGSTFACMKTHITDPNNPVQVSSQSPASKKEVMAAQEKDPMPEVQNGFWVLTSMLGMQGPTGSTGPSGADGKPSVNLVLSNESHTFSANPEGAIINKSTTTTEIQAYIGTELATADKIVLTIPTGADVPKGMNLSWDSEGMVLTIEALAGMDLADSGSFPINAKVKYGVDKDNKPLYTAVRKNFSWVKARNAESPYTVMVYSTNGNIFQKGTTNTTLKATVLHGEQDVSIKMKDKVVWYKVTPTQDIKWAEKVLEIKIDPSQVDGQAVFACEVEV